MFRFGAIVMKSSFQCCFGEDLQVQVRYDYEYWGPGIISCTGGLEDNEEKQQCYILP